MKTRWFFVMVIGFMAVSATGDLVACGDKFLVPSRSLRFGLTRAVRQEAAVLFYVNPATALPAVLSRLSVDPAVRKAGYRPTVVATTEEFLRKLGEGRWDVVLIDLADGSTGTLSAAEGSPVVVAVALNSTGVDLIRAEKEYSHILKSPTRSQSFVDALDVAVAEHRSARNKAVRKVL
jgi:hypothetical protein